MKLIADSGSTKTHWYIKETNKHIFTKGYNPYFESTEEIKHSINLELLPQIEKEKIQERKRLKQGLCLRLRLFLQFYFPCV